VEFFKEKLGPLPFWAWLAITTALVAVYVLWEKHKQGSSSATSATAQQQLLAAEEAAAANAANATAVQTPNYNYGGYNGSGGRGHRYAHAPAASTTAPAAPAATATTTGASTGTTGPSAGTLGWFQNGQPQSGSPQQFLAAFQATGQNAGQIVPGGTGQPMTAPAPPKVAATPISNLHASGISSTGATLSWSPDQNSQGYAWILSPVGGTTASAQSGHTSGTSVSLSGLKSKTQYNFGIQGLPGGAGTNIHFTTS
jgi:hypothetical protein